MTERRSIEHDMTVMYFFRSQLAGWAITDYWTHAEYRRELSDLEWDRLVVAHYYER